MKIVDFDKFNISEKLTVSEFYIGNTGSKIVKIKNFFKHPEFMREYALNAYYIDEKKMRNLGKHDEKTHWFTHRFSMDFDQYDIFFDKVKVDLFFDGNIQYTPLPNHYNFQYYDKMHTENFPHNDPVHYAGVLSLNYDHELKGTGSATKFHRLKKTGEEYTLNNTYRSVRPNNSPIEDFECYHSELHEFNTFIIYEARLLHSAYCDYSKWTSDVKRLTFNCFTW